MRHIVTDHVIVDENTIFLISPYTEKSIQGGAKYTCVVPTSIFQKVQNFVRLFDDGLRDLKKKDSNGNIPYWEKNWHDHYVDTLQSLMPNCLKVDISNALSALGY